MDDTGTVNDTANDTAKSAADSDLFALYDEYCHTDMPRREFLVRAAALGAVAGLVGCSKRGEALLPRYAECETVSFTDPRIKASYVDIPSPGGNAETIRGYLVTPSAESAPAAQRLPCVLVVHENRGLNPYIEDVARRVALEGFIALAPDALSAAGGYPGNDDDGKALQKSLDGDKILVDMQNSARFLLGHERSSGKLGVTGFCFGGGVSNHLAVALGDDLKAAAPFYGRPPDLARVSEIRAELLIHFAEDDPRVNATRADYESALRAASIKFESHVYPGTMHGFHNNSTPRYNAAAAKLAWQRTIDLFKSTLA